MLSGFMEIFSGAPYLISLLSAVISALIVPAIHEFVKGFVSNALGDTMPKNNNRLTLNPKSHFDLLGFICGVLFGYSWGKPVNTYYGNYKNKRIGTVLTYSIPTIVNFLLSIVFLFIGVKVLYPSIEVYNMTYQFGADFELIPTLTIYLMVFCEIFAFVNFSTAMFNLIPATPADMAVVIGAFVPVNYKVNQYNIDKVLNFLLLFFIFSRSLQNIIGFAWLNVKYIFM